jgi:hypothetical protein
MGAIPMLGMESRKATQPPPAHKKSNPEVEKKQHLDTRNPQPHLTHEPARCQRGLRAELEIRRERRRRRRRRRRTKNIKFPCNPPAAAGRQEMSYITSRRREREK